MTWWQVLLLTLLLVIAMVLLVKCCMELYQGGWMFSKATCYLCLQKVERRAWTGGKHRQECIQK